MSTTFCNIYAQFDQTGDNLPKEVSFLLGLGLVCDTCASFAQLERHTAWLKKIKDAGGIVAPTIYPQQIDPENCRDSNWWRYSEDECIRLITIAKNRYEALGMGEMTAVNTYTPGNTFVAACRKLGVKFILGFCAPTVIEDGGWSIAHYGSPLAPYFVSDEDFRKPENPEKRSDPLMIMSMELRNPMVCLSHWSEGPWCPLNALAADRSLEPTQQPIPFLSIAQDWIDQTELTGESKFFQINLQFFFTEKCYDHNRRALEWLAARKREGKLEVGSGQQWAEISRKHDGLCRQVTYWRGEMPGFHVGNRAGIYPDVIVDESLNNQTIWQAPDALPRRLYDYEKTWDYPAFKPDGSAPESTDFSDCTVSLQTTEDNGNVKTIATIKNSGAERKVKLMLWGALGLGKGTFTISGTDGWAFKTVPHPAGTGGAVMAEGKIPAGESALELTVTATETGLSCTRRWSELLAAETFFFEEQPFTVLASQVPDAFTVQVKVNPPVYDPVLDSPQSLNARPVARLESLCGTNYTNDGKTVGTEPVALSFDSTKLACWHRLWGVTADQLIVEGVEEAETILRRKTSDVIRKIAPDTKVPTPGYQTFGPLTDKSRWDLAVGQAAGLCEKEKMNTWFKQQRPEAGQTVIEVHPGLFLPHGGSITKTLGHCFDNIECADGYDFQELAADYPQAWDWGIGGWVMWRHLNICLKGLKGKSGKHMLHIHAFDAEARDLVQRIHVYDADSLKRMDICLAPNWVVPVGVEGRWDPRALCSVELPELCMQWDSIGVWINPMEKARLYDWVAEKGAPGFFSHLWVTRS